MSEWISVLDSYPGEDENFSALVCSIRLELYCAAQWRGRDSWECLEGGELLEWTPTHWMPLPEMPGAS